MSQSVETMIEDLIGAIPDSNSTAVTQWASDVAREVINVLPTEMLWSVSEEIPDSGGGSGATLTLVYAGDAGNKSVTSVAVNAAGSGYTSDPLITVVSPTGDNAVIRGFSDGDDLIAVDLVSGGSGYLGSETATVTGQNGASVTTAKFLHAHKNGYKAIEIRASDKARATDSNSIYKATTNNPVFYRDQGKVHVEPSGGSVVVVSYPTISYDDSAVTGVPDDVKHLVIMGTAVKGRLYQLDQIRREIDSFTLPSYIPSNATLSLVPVPSITDLSVDATLPDMDVEAPSISISLVGTESIGSITVGTIDDAPVYNPPVLTLTAELDLPDLSVSSIPPTPIPDPNLADTTVSFSGIAAPEYTKPVLNRDFSGATTQITTNEDVELANAELDKISKQINSFQADVENELNKFNKESTEYQAKVQKATQDAQLGQGKEFTEYANKLQKYSADLSKYQQEVNKEIQEYTINNVQKKLGEWQAKREHDFQKYQLKMQDALNQFNEGVTSYQTSVQTAVKNVDIAVSNAQQNVALERDREKQNAMLQYQKDLEVYKLRLQRYITDLQEYQADVATQVQTYTINKIQKDIQLWQAEQSHKLQKYGGDQQKEATRFGSELQEYQAGINNIFQKHQTMVQELQVLDAQYSRGLQTFVASYQEPVQNAKGV